MPATSRLLAPLRLWVVVLALLLPLLFGGCIDEWTDGDVTHFGRPLWMLIVMGGMSLSISGMGWLIREWSQRVGLVVMVAGGVMLFFAFTLCFERVSIDARHLSCRLGFLGLEQADVDFETVRAIDLTTETRTNKGSTRKDDYVRFKSQDGGIQFARLTGVMMLALPHVREKATARGLAINDERQPHE